LETLPKCPACEYRWEGGTDQDKMAVLNADRRLVLKKRVKQYEWQAPEDYVGIALENREMGQDDVDGWMAG
jgi:hypothetical protein